MYSDAPLKIECLDGKTPGTRVFELRGPITLGNLFGFQEELRREDPLSRAILDLSDVPYIDSAGLGAIVNYFTHCERKGIRMALVGVSSRVGELFRMTRLDGVIPMVGSRDEAEGGF